MKKALIFLFIIPILVVSGFVGMKNTVDAEDTPRYYRLAFKYSEESGLEFDRFNIRTSVGLRESNKEPGDFLAKLYSIDDELLVEGYFSPKGEGNFYLELQYRPTGKLIEIFDINGEKLFEKNVQVFAKVCGDGECQEHESYENCKEDCPSGQQDDMCDKQADGMCDPDCHNIKDFDPDCTGEHPSVKYAVVRKKIEEQKQAEEDSSSGITAIADGDSEKPFFKVFMFLMMLVIVVSLVIIFFLFKKRE